MVRFFLIFIYVLIFILGLEFASFTTFKVNKILDGTRDTKGAMERSGLYKNLDLEKYKDEAKALSLSKIFDPYRSYRVRPNFKGEFINTDSLGRRYTKGSLAPKNQNEISIGIFGGSTIWGVGSESDLHTIPSLLFVELNKKNIQTYFRVFNYGVEGYNQTQEMIYLVEALRTQRFDIVIFYDFVNESLHGYREANLRKDQTPISFLRPTLLTPGPFNRYLGIEKPLTSKIKKFIRNLYSFRMFNHLKLKFHLIKKGETEFKAFSDNNIRSLKINRVIDNYYHNMEIIKAIGRQNNFLPIFILQPTLFTKKKLSEFEKTIDHLKFPDYIEFEEELYKKIKIKFIKNNLVTNFSDIFSDQNISIYIDDHHMSSIGNKILAHRMADLVLETLN